MGAKEDREGSVGKITVNYDTKSRWLGGSNSTSNEDNLRNAKAQANSIYDQQEEFSSMYRGGTLLTQGMDKADEMEDLLSSGALSGSYGYTDSYDDILGNNDPTSFLKAYRGYVEGRKANVSAAQKKSNTFLTGAN